jgi:CHASE2 domain-containing sensor protein
MNTRTFIKEHTHYIRETPHGPAFLAVHTAALITLRHERLLHLLVTLAVTLFALIFLSLYLAFKLLPLLAIFLILLVVMAFYFLYYYKLENTTLVWEEIEYQARREANAGD